MKKNARRVLGPFTDRELKIIELRTNGMERPEIARQMGSTPRAVSAVTSSILKKAGVSNLVQLTRWAIETGLDMPALPDTPENAPVPEPKKKWRGRIKLGRIRRSKRMV